MPTSAPRAFSIRALNRASQDQATAMLDRIIERAPWLAGRAARARPFRDAADLAGWLEAEVRNLPRDDAVQLLCAHPELAPPVPFEMTAASQGEQGRLHLLNPDPAVARRMSELNRQYLRRYGYPCVIALHEHGDLSGVIAAFEGRIAADDPDGELAHALGQVVSVMKDRLARLTGATGPMPVITQAGAKP